MSSRIRRITITPVRVPIPFDKVNSPEFPEPLNRGPTGGWVGGTFIGDVPFSVIKVEGTDGSVGWSDATRLADTQEMIYAAGALIGMSELHVTAAQSFLVERINSIPPDQLRGQKPANSQKAAYSWVGLELAVMDWATRQRGQPLHVLFGKKVRDRVRVEYWSAFHTPANAARIAKEAKDQGFVGLKLKAHLGIDAAGIAKAILDACGPDFHVTIDPNGRWETLENTLARAEAIMKVSRSVMLEDPIYRNLEALAEVRRQTGIQMAVTCPDLAKLQRTLELDAADAFNLGGRWSDLKQTSEAARQANKPFWLGSSIESGIGDLTTIHIASTMPNCTLGCDCVGYRIRADDLLKETIHVQGGHARVPDGSGRGIDTDEDAVERHRVGEPVIVQ